MNAISKYISGLAALMVLSSAVSCNDYLNIKPKGITIPEYYDDYLKLLNYKQLMYGEQYYPVYLSDDALLGEPDLQFGSFELAQDYVKNLYSFKHGAVFSDGETDQYYENAYSRIYTFNTIINNAGTCSDGTPEQVASLIAEAKVNRAFEYLFLVNAYAKVYDKETASADLGVPLVTSEDIGKEYRRGSVQEVYDQIFKDLSEAEEYIPEKAATPFRASRNFLYAYQTKLYLYMGDWPAALSAAEQVDIDELEFLDYTDYSINPDANGMGRIWNASTEEVYPDPEDNPESIYTRSGMNVNLCRQIYASEGLLRTFEKDLPEGAVDQRRALFYADDEFKLYNVVAKFPGKTMYVSYIQQNVGLGTPEFYLMYAEACIRNNDIEKGISLINTLRDNRIIGNVHISAEGMSQDRALELLFDERRREFCHLGSYRLFDMKRLMAEGRYTDDVVHTVGDEEYRIPANDNRLILPIPPKVLAQNPDMPVYDR